MAGCGGTTPATGNPTGGSSRADFLLYDGAAFTIGYQKDWEKIEKANFTSNVPAETMVAFRNNLKNEIFTANVNISQTAIPADVTAVDFGKSSLLKAKEGLVAFVELSKEDFAFKYKDKTIATIISGFEGKKSPSDPIIRFKQLYVVNNGFGYVVTAAYLPGEDESVVKMTDEMLHSFLLK
jgi:hypothetical protein